ncbi:uncharacterized protein LOC135370070 isoform X2 [Ornithodoros turicata]|uniref:uncharacterized protein LOC135370070 isoform X2 n=1 Tax=Ornithodoros turicata TaxID=34597 RepID=UPI0031392CDE
MYKWRPYQVFVIGDYGFQNMSDFGEYAQRMLNMLSSHDQQRLLPRENGKVIVPVDPNLFYYFNIYADVADIVLVLTSDELSVSDYYGWTPTQNYASLCMAYKLLLMWDAPNSYSSVEFITRHLIQMLGAPDSSCLDRVDESCCSAVVSAYKKALSGYNYACYNTELTCCLPRVAEAVAFDKRAFCDIWVKRQGLPGFQLEPIVLEGSCKITCGTSAYSSVSVTAVLPDGIPCGLQAFAGCPDPGLKVCQSGVCNTGFYDRLLTLRSIWDLPLQSKDGPQCT